MKRIGFIIGITILVSILLFFLVFNNRDSYLAIDTKYCRLYYTEENEMVKKIAEDVDSIYEEVYSKFQHHVKDSVKEDGLLIIYLLDERNYKKLGNSNARASWTGSFIKLNLDKFDKTSKFDYSIRHEMIHAVTCDSNETKARNIPGWFSEGVAMYYQSNTEGEPLSSHIIKEAIQNKEVVPWSEITPKGNWGNEKRKLKYIQTSWIYKYLIELYGEKNINNIFYIEGDFYRILKNMTGKSIDELENDWLKYMTKVVV